MHQEKTHVVKPKFIKSFKFKINEMAQVFQKIIYCKKFFFLTLNPFFKSSYKEKSHICGFYDLLIAMSAFGRTR